MRRILTIGLLAASALCAGASLRALAETVPIGRYVAIEAGVSGHPYPMPAVDARRSGRSRARLLPASPKPLWQRKMPERRLTPPAVFSDGSLAIGSAAGVHRLSPIGSSRFVAEIGPVHSTPSVTPSGGLVALTTDGRLFSIDPRGRAAQLADNLVKGADPLLLDSGVIVVGARGRQTLIVDLDGMQVDRVALGFGEALWPVLVGEGLVALSGRFSSVGLISLPGSALRRIRLSQRALSQPAVSDDGTIWIVGEHGLLWGLSPTGRVRASGDIGQPSTAPVIGGDGGVRVGIARGEVVCVGPGGAERWRRGVDARPGPMLLDVDDTLLFVSARGTLYAIESDGALRYRYPTGMRAAGRPVLGGDGTIYLASQHGLLHAFR